jgi:hypothetical protein
VLAKELYAQDVASQKAEAIRSVKQEAPLATAFLPRTAENIATGDRSTIGTGVDFAKDIFSFPGRVANAALGFGAERAAQMVYGPRDQETQMQMAEESIRNAIGKTAEYEAPTDANKVSAFAQNLLTDPYAIPMIAVGGPIAGKIAGSGLSTLGKIGAGIGADAALNTVVGAFERGTSENPEARALDPKAMALDAALGGTVSGLMHGIGHSGRKLLGKTKADLGEEVIASTPRKLRDDVISAFDPSGDKDKAATAIGEYLTTTSEGKYIPVTRNPFGKSAPEAITENVAQKQTSATKGLNEQYSKLDAEYDRAVLNDQIIKEPTGVDASGNVLNAEGNPVGTGTLGSSPEHIRNYGVPLTDILDQTILSMKLAERKAYDMNAIAAARNDILSRFSPHNMYEGTIAPSTARDLKHRIYAEITDNPKKSDLDEFYTEVYRNINDHIANLEHGTTEAIYRNKNTGEMVRESQIKSISDMHKYEPIEGFRIGEENLVSAQNLATRQALSLGEGLERSRYFNPQARQTQLGDAADVAKLALATSNPVALAASIGKLPGGKRLAAQELSGAVSPLALNASRVAAGSAVQARNASRDTRKQEQVQFAQIANNVTEMEYKNLKNIMALHPSRRTPEMNAYLQKYLSR